MTIQELLALKERHEKEIEKIKEAIRENQNKILNGR